VKKFLSTAPKIAIFAFVLLTVASVCTVVGVGVGVGVGVESLPSLHPLNIRDVP
jgi:hypothetical protein